jgi:hypothetical protein
MIPLERDVSMCQDPLSRQAPFQAFRSALGFDAAPRGWSPGSARCDTSGRDHASILILIEVVACPWRFPAPRPVDATNG